MKSINYIMQKYINSRTHYAKYILQNQIIKGAI